MSSWALSSLRRVAVELQSFEDGRFPQDAAEACILCLEPVYREFLVQEQVDGHSSNSSRVRAMVSTALDNLRRLQIEPCIHHHCRPPALHTGRVGRPRFDIPQEQFITLFENGFTRPQIADIVGVSLSTIYRRMVLFGLSVSSEYANLSNSELDQVIGEIKLDFPTCGNKQMQGHLRSRGYRVQQIRIREALRRVDPEGSIMRRLSALNRRQYRVAAPRSLWHIDGNHKMIRHILSRSML